MADPLSAGASVVAFVGIALSSAKTIYDVLSAVKDGPEMVKHLAEEVKQLQDILARLSAHLQASTVNRVQLEELATVATRCNTGLTDFETKLRRLDISEKERRIGRIWKRLKTAITKKGLERMQETIRDYTSVLNIRLTYLNMAHLSVSTTQYAEILALLRQVVSTLPPQSALIGTPEEAMPDAPPERNSAEVKLEESIERLVNLVTEKECTVESDEAEQLISNLQTLLDSALAKELLSTPAEIAPDVEETITVDREPNLLKELKLTSNLLLSAPMLSINSAGMLDVFKHMPQGVIIQQQRKRKVINISGGSLTVTTNTRRRLYKGGEAPIGGDNGSGRDFLTKILFRPSTGQSLVSIYLRQGQVLNGSFSSIPKVLFSNIIPTESPAFNIAANGQVEELKSLLMEGQANLHDRSPDGWSVLHYAADADNVHMTRFLVENGLDVDEICCDEEGDDM